MKASEVLAALRVHHNKSAFVPELGIEDQWALTNKSYAPGEVPTIYKRRIDALMFASLQLTAIEIKVTKADAKRETWMKVLPWKRVTHRFVYAVPAGLLLKPPVNGCGLWWVHEDGKVEVIKAASINKYPEALPLNVIQNIAYRASNASALAADLSRDLGLSEKENR